MSDSSSFARKKLIILWFGFFVINILLILFLYFDKWILKDNFSMAFKVLNQLYAPFIGAITLFYWTKSKKKKQQVIEAGIPYILAFICSLIWNALIFLFILILVFKSGTIEASFQNIKEIGGMLSWLVGSAIGYYFANSQSI